MQRVEGRIFKPMALTLTFALIAGTVFAIVVVPALASIAVRGGKIAAHEAWIVRVLLRLYRPSLAFALRVPKVVYLVAAILLFAGGLIYTRLGSEFLPKLDEGCLLYTSNRPRSSAMRPPTGQQERCKPALLLPGGHRYQKRLFGNTCAV